VTVVLLRHASAGDRAEWTRDDRLRPLDPRGRRQAAKLVAPLLELGVTRVLSSPYVRCVQSVEPLAEALGVEVELDDRLAEGAGRTALELLESVKSAVACTHGDIVEEVLGHALKKGRYALIEI
jgi:phosphohistidine phosphatase SixA